MTRQRNELATTHAGNKAQLEVNEDSTGWNLADAAAICAEHGATLADS